MKKFIQRLILFIVIIAILCGIGVGIYFFSPEVKPGEAGLLYKTFGSNKGFTGKILTPGKYYCFITDFNPFIHKIYKIKLYSKNISLAYKNIDGISFDISVLYEIDEKNIENFVKKINNNEDKKVVSLYVRTDIKEILSNCSLNDIFKKDFQEKLNIKLTKAVNEDLSYFGIRVNRIDFKNIIPSSELKSVYEKVKNQEKQLALVKMETEQKLKEAKLRNRIKEENLNFLLKKAEAEKEIIRLKTESQKLIREEDKKRMLEETEIFSKPGGALAAKLEAIRILANSVKNPEKVLDKVNNVFEK